MCDWRSRSFTSSHRPRVPHAIASVVILADPTAAPPRPHSRRPNFLHAVYVRLTHVPVVPAVTTLGLVFWFVACLVSRPLDPNSEGGFLSRISPLWYVGIILIATGWGLSGRVGQHAKTDGTKWAGFAVVTMTIALAATPPIIYPGVRFSWTLKHVGVTEYILAYHSVNSSIDIYQAWPGFFAAMATLCRSAGLSDPIALARWWPLIVDLVALAAMRQLSRKFLSEYRSWVACGIFVLGNAIGQDYYSPQSISFAFAILIFALAVEVPGGDSESLIGLRIFTIAILSFAIAVTHQLTPFMVAIALAVLVIFRLVRFKWLPLVPIIPAAFWAFIQIDEVRRYFKLGSIGDFGTNIRLHQPGAPIVHTLAIGQVDLVAWLGASALIAAAALLTTWQHRNRLSYALLLCAVSPVALFFFNQYGGEGTFRVILFALPWLSIGAAQIGKPLRIPLSSIFWIGLPILLAANIVGSAILDWVNVVRPNDLAAERYFEAHAPNGSVLVSLGSGYAPTKSTRRYPSFSYLMAPGVQSALLPNGTIDTAQADSLAISLAISSKRPASKYFVLAGEQIEASGEYQRVYSGSEYRAFVSAMKHSQYWVIVYNTPTSVLFQLRAPPVLKK